MEKLLKRGKLNVVRGKVARELDIVLGDCDKFILVEN